MSNIHQEMTDEKIKQWFKGLTQKAEIIYITRCYKISDQSARVKLILTLTKTKRALKLEEKQNEETRKATGIAVQRESKNLNFLFDFISNL